MKNHITVLTALFLSVLAVAAVAVPTHSIIDASSDEHTVFSEMLDSKVREKTGGISLSDKVTLVTADEARSQGNDLSSIPGGGYMIRTLGDETVIAASDSDTTDRAIRRFVNDCVTEQGTLAVDDISIVWSRTHRVKKIILSGTDISEYVITVPKDANELVKNAASELALYIEKSCGANLSIITAPSDKAHTIELTIDPTAPGDTFFTYGDLGTDGFSVKIASGRMSIVGGNMHGVAYGVYDFLEKYLGWRFLCSGEPYQYEADTITVDNVDYTETTPFIYRGSTYVGTTNDTVLTMRDNSSDSWNISPGTEKIGYGLGTMWYHAHSFAYQVDGYPPSEIYGNEKLLGIDGTNNPQPCLTDEGIRDNIVQSMLYLLEERVDGWGFKIGKEATYISCSMNDNGNFCSCKKCRERIKEEGTVAGPYLELVNYAAEVINENYPGMKVYTIIYLVMGDIPNTVRPSENVVVHYCITACNNHPYASDICNEYDRTSLDRDNVSNRQFLKNWIDISPTLFVWYYISNFNNTLAITPIIENLYEDIQYIASLGADGFYGETTYFGEEYNFEYFLQKYLVYKLMWNPYRTREEFDAMIDEYLTIQFGEGANELREYIEMKEESTAEIGCFTNNYHLPFDIVSRDYIMKNYDYMKSLFDRAAQRAHSAGAEDIIRASAQSLEFLELSATYKTQYENGDSVQKNLYKQKYIDFIDNLRKYGIKPGPGYSIPDNYDLSKSPMEIIYGEGSDSREKR